MSLRLKMIFGIGSILLLAILFYTIMALRSQAKHLLNMAGREANLIASVAERAVVSVMEEGKSHEVQAILQRIGEDPDLAGIRIVDPKGVILRSNRSEEVGRILPQREQPLEGESSQSPERPI